VCRGARARALAFSRAVAVSRGRVRPRGSNWASPPSAQITPSGTVRNEFAQSCWDGGINFNPLSHECAVSPSNPFFDNPVVTLEYEVRAAARRDDSLKRRVPS
jgi:hypothetical protein